MEVVGKFDYSVSHYECLCIDDSLPVGESSDTMDMETWIKKGKVYIGTPDSRLDEHDGNIPYLKLMDVEPQSIIRSYPGFNPKRFSIVKIEQHTKLDSTGHGQIWNLFLN